MPGRVTGRRCRGSRGCRLRDGVPITRLKGDRPRAGSASTTTTGVWAVFPLARRAIGVQGPRGKRDARLACECGRLRSVLKRCQVENEVSRTRNLELLIIHAEGLACHERTVRLQTQGNAKVLHLLQRQQNGHSALIKHIDLR